MSDSAASSTVRWAITVRGIVQGVGFRPFVYRIAQREGLTGWVRNESDRVLIEVEGEPAPLARFLETLRHGAPPPSRIDQVHCTEIPPSEDPRKPFEIRFSQSERPPRPTIPADLATCPQCLAEVNDPSQRRYRYPFTNCTYCGPRWSIIERLPYDRPRTSMASFPLCPDCQREYREPADRRFHAQPIACPACGPRLELRAADGPPLAAGDAALVRAAAALVAGQIVALKGLGGFQLLVDATDEAAVARLRRRKHRPDKPLALLMGTLEAASRRCRVTPDEAAALASAGAPIVLLRRRDDAGALDDIAPDVAPGNRNLGVMLPCTPLHHLLAAEAGRPLVCTSGNLAEEPMAITFDEARRALGGVADWFLTHDRPIVRPVDDSVARVSRAGLHMLRRARGFAPLALPLASDGPPVLAVGGHLKNAVALALDGEAVVGSHVGDLDGVASREVHRRAVDDLLGFFAVRPAAVACDLHPDYASTQLAEELAAGWSVPLVRVQHHHAHVAACQAEHHLEGPVLGLAWDGVGYGPDGTVWGGEALRCEGASFTRVAHLRTFPLPGGDRAAREPRRCALGLLYEVLGDAATGLGRDWFPSDALAGLTASLGRRLNAPRTSSMGRLFDAVAALAGLAPVISFEGQAAIALEHLADDDETGAYPFPLVAADRAGTRFVADWEPMVRALLADRQSGAAPATLAARFHNALVELALATARAAGCPQVALCGGCFQNARLADCTAERLRSEGLEVYTPMQVPPGDGGIALGQLYVARHGERASARS